MRYERPHSMEDAVGLLAASDGIAAILAGGSDLLVRMKGGFGFHEIFRKDGAPYSKEEAKLIKSLTNK